jgi:phosphoheptose isomerase
MGDLSVIVTSSSIKTVEESSQDLISCLRLVDEILVLGNVVSASDVLNTDKSISILVHGLEGTLNHSQLAFGELVSESS